MQKEQQNLVACHLQSYGTLQATKLSGTAATLTEMLATLMRSCAVCNTLFTPQPRVDPSNEPSYWLALLHSTSITYIMIFYALYVLQLAAQVKLCSERNAFACHHH